MLNHLLEGYHLTLR